MGKYTNENPNPYSVEYANDPNLRKYFSNLALRYLSLLKLHRETGLLPTPKNTAPEQRENNIATTGQPDWSNVTRHSLAEAGAAQALARLLGLPKENEIDLVGGAIVHDLNKMIENQLFKSSPQNPEAQTTAYNNAAEIGTKILLDNHIDPKIIKIAKAAGHHNAPRITKPETSLEEKILYYLDNITQNTELVSLETKLKGLKERYPDLYEAGEYNDWIASSKQIQTELAGKLGLIDPDKLPSFITQKVKQLATEQSRI